MTAIVDVKFRWSFFKTFFMDTFCPTVYTAWIQDCDDVVSYYPIPVLTLCGGYPFQVPTYLLDDAGRTDEADARNFFERHEADGKELEASPYKLLDFDFSDKAIEILSIYQ